MNETPAAVQGPPSPSIRAARAMGSGIRALFSPPFRVIVLLACVVSLVAQSVPADQSEWAGLALLVLLAISVYLQIATILAGGHPEPDRSADAWVKAAFRRRCFWRFMVAGMLQLVVILVALIFGLVVGGIVMMGMLGLAQTAAALERTGPIESCRRSSDVGRPARRAIAVIYLLLLVVPGIMVQIGYAIGWSTNQNLAWLALGIVAVGLQHAGLISLTRIFVQLGGRATPPMDQIAPEPTLSRLNG